MNLLALYTLICFGNIASSSSNWAPFQNSGQSSSLSLQCIFSNSILQYLNKWMHVWWWLRTSHFTLAQPSGNLFQLHSHRCWGRPTQHLPQKDPEATAHESWHRWEEGRGGRENTETNAALMLMLRMPILLMRRMLMMWLLVFSTQTNQT